LFKNLLIIFKILGKKNIFFLLSLIPAGIVVLIFELFSIATFVPLLQASFIGNNLYSNEVIYKISTSIISYLKSINLLLIISFCIIILKNFFIILQNYYFYFITKKIYLFIADRIFLSTISQNYLAFYEKNSSNFIKDLRETTINFRIYLETIIFFFIEVVVTILIITFLLIVYFKVTIIILSFFVGSVYLLIYFSRNLIKINGKKQNEVAEKLNSILINSFNNFIDIKIYNRANFFQKLYKENNIIFAECVKKILFMYSLSKPIIELLVILTLVFFIFNISNDEFMNYVGVLGLYLIAFYRLLPSAIRISNLKMSMNNHSFSVKIISDIIKNYKEDKKPIVKIKSNIKFHNVSFSYDKKNIILNNVNLIFKKNYITCLYGNSGCGKTTLVRLIAGLIKPNVSGKIMIDKKFEYKNLSLDISYVSQNFFIMNDTLAKNIAFADNKQINLNKIDKIIKMLELDIVLKNKDITYQSIISEDASLFSGGQRQRIAIARALYKDSDILILDESTNALDLRTEAKIVNNLHSIKLNKIIIIISHRKEIKNLCDYSYNLS
jgi:ABC-type bacteriocin/lantibiotic exporter with double-glycine peptidase domain